MSDDVKKRVTEDLNKKFPKRDYPLDNVINAAPDDLPAKKDKGSIRCTPRHVIQATLIALGMKTAEVSRITCDGKQVLYNRTSNKAFKRSLIEPIKHAIAMSGLLPITGDTAEEYVKGIAPRTLKRLVAIESFDPTMLYDKKTGEQLSPQELPPNVRLAIKEIEGPIYQRIGKDGLVKTYKYRLESKNDAVKELLSILGYDMTKGRRKAVQEEASEANNEEISSIDFGPLNGAGGDVGAGNRAAQ